MKRAFALVVLLLMALPGLAGGRKILPTAVLNAKYVIVIPQSVTQPTREMFNSETGPEFSVAGLTNDERNGYTAVQNAFQSWGKYRVTQSWRQADLRVFISRSVVRGKPAKNAPRSYRDEMQVYLADGSEFPAWRGTGIDGLSGSDPKLVQQFRQAVEEAAKDQELREQRKRVPKNP